MGISVCLIVKNEEKVLRRCLNCVIAFADEIIVVDTGSSDRTVEIAKNYTNKIYYFAWIDDFAAARNFSFSKATEDYAMWIDADDFIPPKEIEKIKSLKTKLTADVYMLKYAVSFDRKGDAVTSFYRERILKRSKYPLWQGFIHESVPPFGKIEYVDVTIEHRKEGVSDPKRNLNIYEKRIKAGELLTARDKYYYAKELYYNGLYERSADELIAYLKMPNKFEPNLSDAYLTIGRCFRELGDNKKALDYLFESLKEIDPSSEILCEIGNVFTDSQNYNRAIVFYESATVINEPDITSGVFYDRNYYYLFPYVQLTAIYYKVGDYEKSKKYHFLAKADDPAHPSVLFNAQFFEK